ncbi:MAG: FAD-dependent oxidoreductase, partial [Bacteroidota bacterium]
MFPTYDVIVVGAGHAGCEAAIAAANLGCRVMLATMNMQTIAQMSCNPAMGGVAKGQIVREIDALGGYSGIITDRTMIQFRILNRSKGPAMHSPRAQSDRMAFAQEWRKMLEAHPLVDFWQEMITGIIVKDGRAQGVYTSLGLEIPAKSVVLTNGTFLNGIIHIGEKQLGGGRAGERAAKGITEQLVELGFEAGRMKTGTPARIDGRTLDYSKMEPQHGDEDPGRFSYTETPQVQEQLAAQRTFPGNRPSLTLVYPLLTPEVLGQIIALYEHRVFVEGVILGINSFDQWGVELGKELANSLLPVVEGKKTLAPKDSSTAFLANHL